MTCPYCAEPILESEPVREIANGTLHEECLVRMVIGSVGHQLGVCSCYGGVAEDPPELSLREAARLARETWRQLHPCG